MQTLVVRARAPLQVRNEALGYRIHYEIDSFSYSFQSNLIYRNRRPLFRGPDCR